MDIRSALELCHAHAAAEAAFDVDGILATLVEHPRYEFFPLGMTFGGGAVVERFYREQYPTFAARVTGYELLGEWADERTAVQEYVIALRGEPTSTRHRVLSMMRVDHGTGLLAGERLYCDDGFARALLGPLWEELEPVGEDAAGTG